MANDEHVALLKQGVDAWNAWREKNPDIRPDLSEVDLRDAFLLGANLSTANRLGAANLGEADLSGANLGWANLSTANRLGAANLGAANLGEADLSGANLGWANLRGANLSEADLRRANLRGRTSSMSSCWTPT
jgi:uncharacterized protein YjbI with pentapeptide repeats